MRSASSGDGSDDGGEGSPGCHRSIDIPTNPKFKVRIGTVLFFFLSVFTILTNLQFNDFIFHHDDL
jgi:hypothetical protein